jgi:RluA family pseudouridine synthase
MLEWTVEPEEDGLSALEVLRRRVPAAPAAYLRQLLRRGKVRLGGAPVAEAELLRAGERLTLPDSRRLGELLQPGGVRILFEDPEALVVFKPAGLAVHRGEGHEADNLTDRVRALLQARGERFTAAPVHRLDAATSGPVLFGKGRRAIAALGGLFMTRQVEKVYLALAAGELVGEGLLSTAVPAKGRLREAATSWRALGSGGGFTLLELRLETGRTHQIRRQLAEAGHPLAGDRRYGGAAPAGLTRLFLHGRRLGWPQPGGERRMVVCPLPEELHGVLDLLGIADPNGADPSSFSTQAEP